jgi:hypothetical protein
MVVEFFVCSAKEIENFGGNVNAWTLNESWNTHGGKTISSSPENTGTRGKVFSS